MRTRREFAAALDRLLDDPALARSLGRNGRDYFARHYSWPVIERKYFDMFERLTSESARTLHGAAAGLVRPARPHRASRGRRRRAAGRSRLTSRSAGVSA